MGTRRDTLIRYDSAGGERSGVGWGRGGAWEGRLSAIRDGARFRQTALGFVMRGSASLVLAEGVARPARLVRAHVRDEPTVCAVESLGSGRRERWTAAQAPPPPQQHNTNNDTSTGHHGENDSWWRRTPPRLGRSRWAPGASTRSARDTWRAARSGTWRRSCRSRGRRRSRPSAARYARRPPNRGSS